MYMIHVIREKSENAILPYVLRVYTVYMYTYTYIVYINTSEKKPAKVESLSNIPNTYIHIYIM